MVRAVSSRFPRVHGEPLHAGDAGVLGIADVARPDYGEPMEVLSGQVPLYWGYGLTALAALKRPAPLLLIIHAPDKMLVTDLLNTACPRAEPG